MTRAALAGVVASVLACAACGSGTKTVIIRTGNGGATTTTVGSSATVTQSGAPTRAYRNPSAAMEPTIKFGQRIVVSLAPGYEPRVGDIVVFHPPAGADALGPICGNHHQGVGHRQACDKPTPRESRLVFVKRIVAGPGDTVTMLGGHVYRNGAREQDSYTHACGRTPFCNFPNPITIPQGDYFLLGDNR